MVGTTLNSKVGISDVDLLELTGSKAGLEVLERSLALLVSIKLYPQEWSAKMGLFLLP